MAWYKPATWTLVDIAQGQRSLGFDPRTVKYTSTPNKTNKNVEATSSWIDMYNKDQASIDSQNADLARMRQQLSALQNQQSYVPKLPTFDILGNYNKAKTQAQKTQKPYYDKLWNQTLDGFKIKRTSKQADANLQKEQAGWERDQTLSDNQLTRGRTVEDVMAAIDQINQGEEQFQTDEGREFDIARRQMQEGVAASGMTTSGLGQQTIGEQVDQRNLMSERQVEQFEMQRAAKQLFQDRTFEDMARGDTRASELFGFQEKGINLDLDSYLKSLAQEQKVARSNWEADYSGAVLEEQDRIASQNLRQFLANLPGSGQYNSQDIAEAWKVYGNML